MNYILFLIALAIAFAIFYFFKYSGQVNILPEEALIWNPFKAKFVFADKFYSAPAEIKKLLINSNGINIPMHLYGKPTTKNYKRVRLSVVSKVNVGEYHRVAIYCEGVHKGTCNITKDTWKALFGWRKNFVLYTSI